MRHYIPEPVLDESAVVSLGPVIDPPFADARPGRVTTVLEEVREVISEAWVPPAAPDWTLAAAMRSPEFAGQLEGRRYELIGVGLLGGKRSPARPVVIVYRYDDDMTLEAVLDADATAVKAVHIRRDQPMLTGSELERARRIAGQAVDLREAGIDVNTGMGLVVSELDECHQRHHHRLADLRFAPPDHRMPQGFAIVDLSTGELVESGVYRDGRLS